MDDRIRALMEAAGAAQRQGRPDLARAHWRAVLEDAPDHPAALNALGADALMNRDLDGAVGFFRRAAQADPGAPELWSNLARGQNLLGDAAGERESLERGLALAPRNFAINLRLAQLLERGDQEGAAAERWTVVMALAQAEPSLPDGVRALLDHGRAYLASLSARLADRVDAALETMRDATPSAERRRADAAINYALGRRSIYLNRCSGLHVPFLPADEFFDDRHFPWFAALASAAPMIRAELLGELGEDGRLPPAFQPYVDLPPGVDADTWRSLDKSTDWSALHFWRDGVRDEATCARFPKTAAFLDTLPLTHLPNRMPTIFFSALAPKTHIPAHTGVTNARAIVHLPLIVPDGCRFRVGGETREWEQDRPFAFDDTIEHEAWNNSASLRVVLIMDGWNPYLTPVERSLIRGFYDAAESGEMAPSVAQRAGFG